MSAYNMYFGNLYFSEEEMRYVVAIAKGETPAKPSSLVARNGPSYGVNDRKRPSSPARDQPTYKYGNTSAEGYNQMAR